jgi:Ca-activated chloride channel family protein
MTRRTTLLIAFASLGLNACMHQAMEPEELADLSYGYEDAGEGSAALIPELQAEPVSPAPPVAQPTTVAVVELDEAPMDDAFGFVEAEESAMPAPEMADMDMGALSVSSSRDAGRARGEAKVAAASVSRSSRSQGILAGASMAKRKDSAAAPAPVSGPAQAYYAPPAEPVATPEPAPDVYAASGAEDYTDHGINPFTIVTQDALSTFSIDVDTASYAIARRKLQEGGLPPEAAVRVEEFVNYFDYGYAEPSSGPFAVHMEAMPDPFRPGHHLLRVGVQGDEISRAERQPVHLTFLADVSGSMSSGDKLPLAKEAMHMLVDSLREDDTVGLCTYAGRVARVLEPTSAANKRAIHDAIEALNSGGSTAMSSGIDIAYEMAWETFEEGHENRVIIMSDGDANVGNTSWEQMLANIKGYADRGVTVSTIGFGMGNYKDTLMEQLSNNGDGNNYYIDSREMAQRVFVEELGGTMVTIARDVKIQVEFNDDSVYSYRLIGYENRDIADADFRNDRVDAGEIGSGHNVTALYDVILRDGYTRELATVRLRWEAPGADKAAQEKAFRFDHTALKETSYLTSRATRIAYSAATFAEILRGSPHAAEISLERLAQFATKAARPGEKDDMELVELMRAADRLGVNNVASR